jgi:hypothetical protein
VTILYHTGTEFTANRVTLSRGTVADIVSVGVYHNVDPNVVPDVADFTAVLLVDGTVPSPDPLAEVGFIDIVSLIGPRGGDLTLTAGDWQRWVKISTASEDVLRPTDVITVK